MPLPSFFIPTYTADQQEIVLDEDNSRHVIQVLRMRPGEHLQLTDGRGHLLEGEILDDHKKRCRIAIRHTSTSLPRASNVTIAISPIKNTSRFEWFLEKAAEIGVGRIIPLLCERTERQSTRHDRLRNILVSAMLQSQQTWLPELPEPQRFLDLITHGADPGTFEPTPPVDQTEATLVSATLVSTALVAAALVPAALVPAAPPSRRLIAHCLEAPRPTTSLAAWIHEQQASATAAASAAAAAAGKTEATFAEKTAGAAAANAALRPETLILIGPEGDFTPKEVEMALAVNFLPVTLGANRLRTETAGVVAAALLCIK